MLDNKYKKKGELPVTATSENLNIRNYQYEVTIMLVWGPLARQHHFLLVEVVGHGSGKIQ